MKNAKIFLMVTAISLMLSMGGSKALAWEGYGSIVPSSEVTEAYESYRADPDLVYYFSGPAGSPDAIIGVNKAYTLDSTLWQDITITTPADFKTLVSGTQFLASELFQSLHGFAILDDVGTAIGTWYSPLETPTFVRTAGGKTVDIHTPYDSGRMSTYYYNIE